jgi:hypothetical protein
MLKRLVRYIKSFFPRQLPTGKASFDAWVSDIVSISGLPDNASTRRVAAMFILQLPPALAYLSIRKVANQLIKAAANQVAAQVAEDATKSIKEASVQVVQEA